MHYGGGSSHHPHGRATRLNNSTCKQNLRCLGSCLYLRLEALESQEALMEKIRDAVSGMSAQRKALQALPKPQDRDAVDRCLKVVPRLK